MDGIQVLLIECLVLTPWKFPVEYSDAPPTQAQTVVMAKGTLDSWSCSKLQDLQEPGPRTPKDLGCPSPANQRHSAFFATPEAPWLQGPGHSHKSAEVNGPASFLETVSC